MSAGDQILNLSPNATQGVAVSGSLVVIKSVTGNTPLDISVNGANRRMEVGDVMGVPNSAEIRVTNTSGTATITVRMYRGDESYASAKVAGSVGVASIEGGGLTDTADQTVAADTTAEIAAASDGRRSVIVQSLDTNAGAIRVGTSNAGATRGLKIGPGDSVTLETSDAVHAHAVGSEADLAVVEIG